MSAPKKQADPASHGKFRDLTAKMNPKGGSPVLINDPSLIAALNNTAGSSGGGGSKTPSISSIVVTKSTNSSSPNLFQAGLGG
jgi:hypothetical protein